PRRLAPPEVIGAHGKLTAASAAETRRIGGGRNAVEEGSWERDAPTEDPAVGVVREDAAREAEGCAAGDLGRHTPPGGTPLGSCRSGEGGAQEGASEGAESALRRTPRQPHRVDPRFAAFQRTRSVGAARSCSAASAERRAARVHSHNDLPER